MIEGVVNCKIFNLAKFMVCNAIGIAQQRGAKPGH